MAFQLAYNNHFPLRMINFAKKYLDCGGQILVGNRLAAQLSKLQIIDYFFPGLFVRELTGEGEEADYDYDGCFIYAPRKQGVLSNWGSYKQKINDIEDCLLGNSRNEKSYKNYNAAHAMIRRAALELLSDEAVFMNIQTTLRDIYEGLNEENRQELDTWMAQLPDICREKNTVSFCTGERTDGFSFDRTNYFRLVEKTDSLCQSGDFRNAWIWFCLGSVFGNHIAGLMDKYGGGEKALTGGIYEEESYRLVPSPSVIARPGFCGRDSYLEQIDFLYSEGNRIVFLYGISGIGKTEIARQYAALHRNQYDVIIYAVYDSSLKDLVISDSPFETRPAVKRLTVNDAKETDAAYFRRKLEIIKKAAGPKTLIILDNFNTETDEDLAGFLNGRYRVLITTQYDYSDRYASIRVREIEDMEKLRDIFMNSYRGYAVERDDPELEELIRKVNCHTYTVVLLGRDMENSGESAGEMLEALNKEGIVSLNEEISLSEKPADAAYMNLIRMFRVFEFNDEERQVMALLAMIAPAAIPAMVFKKWAGLASTKSILSLEKRGWIMRSPEGITLHSVVQSVIRYVMPLQTDQIRYFLDNAAADLSDENSWNYTKAQKEQYCSICRYMLAAIGPVNEHTVRFVERAAVLFGYSGHPEQAIRLDEQLYRYRYETDGPGDFETARAAYRTGWAWLFSPNLGNSAENALPWLLKSCELFKDIPKETIYRKSMYCGLLENISKAYGELYTLNNDETSLLSAADYAETAVGLGRRWKDEFLAARKTPAGSFLRLADVYMSMESYEKAMALIDEAYEMLMAVSGKMTPDVLRATSRRAVLLYHLGRYEESLRETDANLKLYKQYYGTDNPSLFDQLVLRVRNSIALGQNERAAAAKKEAMRAGRAIFTQDSPRLHALENMIVN